MKGGEFMVEIYSGPSPSNLTLEHCFDLYIIGCCVVEVNDGNHVTIIYEEE